MVLTLGSFFVSLLAILFVLVCLFMMLVILIQKPKGGGLSGAFGGAGGGEQSVLGAKAGDVLTWVTITCFVLFLLLAMGLTWTIAPTQVPTSPGTLQPAPTSGSGGAAPATTGTQTPSTSQDQTGENADDRGATPATGDDGQTGAQP